MLTAKADRIDSLADDTLAIIDYKTGEPPKEKEVLDGLAPQLPLEAAIAEAGGFRGFQPAEVSALHYWRLRGDDQDGEQSIKEAERLADAALDGLRRLIDTFDDPTYALRGPAASASGAALQRLRAPGAGQGVGGRRGERRVMDAPCSLFDDPNERAARRQRPARLGLGRRLGRHRQDQGADRPGAAADAERHRAAAHPLPDLHQGGGGGDGQPHRRSAGRLGHRRRGAAGGEADRPARPASRPTNSAAWPASSFARVLDAPGGLNIQTIHAFCQSLLGRFPLEAGVAPHSTVDGRARLRRTCWRSLARA